MTENFVTGQLYWHKYPYDGDENNPCFYYSLNKWMRFPSDKHERQGYMLTFLGETDSELRMYLQDDNVYGVFIFMDEKIAVNMNDLCVVDLNDKWVKKLIKKYGDK